MRTVVRNWWVSNRYWLVPNLWAMLVGAGTGALRYVLSPNRNRPRADMFFAKQTEPFHPVLAQ
jgi:hypothetical protein